MLSRRYLVTRAVVRLIFWTAVAAVAFIGPHAGAALIGATPS